MRFHALSGRTSLQSCTLAPFSGARGPLTTVDSPRSFQRTAARHDACSLRAMLSRVRALFRPRQIRPELDADINRLLVERLRVGVLLALVLIPSFVPLDYMRMPEYFTWAVGVRA